MTDIQESDIVRAARSFLGAPFVHCGRNRFGVDCVGLLICSAQECGLLSGYVTTPYNRVVVAERLLGEVRRFCDPVEGDWQPGDVLTFAILGNVQHVGLWTGSSVIHAYQSVGKVVEHPLIGNWRRRLAGVYRFRELA